MKTNTIHEQVQKQLNYLKSWVDGEEERKKECKKWNIPYIPSNRKYENEKQYKKYLEEIEKNRDKNLIVQVRMKGNDGINMYGVYSFVRRYADDYEHLIYRTENGAEILLKRSEVEIVI